MPEVDIDTIPAGREIDALVAEKVFGCEVVEEFDDVEMNKFCHIEAHHHEGEGVVPLIPYYSTDIAAAWDVLVKLYEEGRSPILNTVHGGWFCCFGRDAYAVIKKDKRAAPLAICRAALKVVC